MYFSFSSFREVKDLSVKKRVSLYILISRKTCLSVKLTVFGVGSLVFGFFFMHIFSCIGVRGDALALIFYFAAIVFFTVSYLYVLNFQVYPALRTYLDGNDENYKNSTHRL